MNPLRQFHDIVSQQGVSFEEKVETLLQFGLSLLNLEIGLVSRIEHNTYIGGLWPSGSSESKSFADTSIIKQQLHTYYRPY